MQQSKLWLFNDDLKQKLENPNLSLEGWIGFLLERKVDVQVKKVETGKSMMGGKTFSYKITYTDPLSNNQLTAIRSKSDFALLQNVLKTRFPDAVVPLMTKGEVDNVHLTALYLKEIAANPFFRRDVTFIDFVNGKLKEFKHVKRNAKKLSEGSLRWLQQMTDYPEFETPEELFRTLKGDLDALEKVQKGLAKNMQNQARFLNGLQEASNGVTSALGDFIDMEQVSEGLPYGSVSGLPAQRLGTNLKKIMEVNQNYVNGLNKSYDGSTLERLIIDPINIDLKVIAGLKKVADFVSSAKADFERAKAVYDSIAPDDSSKLSSQNKMEQKEAIFYKARRALGFELERFRTFRTIKFQALAESYAKFNLRGAKEIAQQWGSTGVNLSPVEDEAFYAQEEFYKSASPASSNFAAITKRMASTNNMSKTLQRNAKKPLQASGSVIPQGPRTVQPSMPAPRLPQKPRLPTPGADRDSDDDDWSDEEDRKGPARNESQPTPPSFTPSPPTFNGAPKPPTGNFGAQPTPPAFNAGPPKPPSSGFNPPPTTAAFKPPSTTPAFQPPVAAPKPPQSQGFGPMGGQGNNSRFGGPPNSNPPTFNPGVKPSGPSFGGPPPSSGFGVPSKSPSPPAFGAPSPSPSPPAFSSSNTAPSAPSFGGAQPRRFGGAPPPPKQNIGSGGGSSKKKKRSRNKGKSKFGGGMPAGPGAGPAFLADIKKPNVKLNKVPETDKSKEIGGVKGKGVGGAVVNGPPGGAGRGPVPPGGGGPPRFGGGGGVMGELASKLNKRR